MFKTATNTKSERKARLREAHKRWLRTISERRGQSLTALSREIGHDQSALTRFMNDEDRGSTLDTLTIAAIAEMTGEPPPAELFGEFEAGAQRGFNEPEAALYVVEKQDPLAPAIAALTGSAPHLVPWRLNSRAIEGEGYKPGDILIVDLNAVAKAGDIVCAQFYDWKNPAQTETVFRVYEAPFLIVSGQVEGNRKPRLVDNDNVMIKGVVRSMLRAGQS